MRTRSNHKFKSDISFLDMLFNMVMAFAFLFIIAIMLINPPTTVDATVKMKAEFIFTMTWPEDAFDDIDLWLQTPDGDRIYYMHQNSPIASLDHDDLGARGDIYKKSEDATEGTLIRENQEIITIRAIVPGRYILSAHVFGIYQKASGLKSEHSLPYEATLKMLKVNPRVQTIAVSKVLLERRAQEAPFIAFDLKEDGTVENVELHPDVSIVALRSTESP